MKNSFILYTDQKEVFDTLSNEDAGKLIKAIFNYTTTGEDGLDGILKAVFTQFRIFIDKDNLKWQEEREKRSLAGKKGMQTRWKQNISSDNNVITNDNSVINGITKITDNDNVNVNVNDNVSKDILKEKQEREKKKIVSESKHKFGEFNNVLLKDSELEKLKEEYPIGSYPSWEDLIKFLDEYIEMKGYKAKSHYLAIKKWVVNAIQEESQRKTNIKPKKVEREIDYNQFTMML